MLSKSDSDATYWSGAEDTMKIQPVRRSQRLSQKSANYNFWWYSHRAVKMSPMHNANSLTQGVFSDTDIREDDQDSHDTLTLQQKSATVIQKCIKTLSDKSKPESFPILASPSPLHNKNISTQAVFSAIDMKEDLKQNKSVTVCRNNTKTTRCKLRSKPYSKIVSSTPDILSITNIKELSVSHEILSPQQKPITFSQKHTKSRKAKSKPYSKKCSPSFNDNIVPDTDIKHMNNNTLTLQQTVPGESESMGREGQNSNDVPLDLSTMKSEESLYKTSMIELDPIKSVHLNNNIHISLKPTSNASLQNTEVGTSANIIQTKSKKVSRPRKPFKGITKRTIKKRKRDNVKRKRNPKIEFIQYCESSTKLKSSKGMRQTQELKTSMLPDIYPSHFKYQLPPEAVLTQPLIPPQPDIMTPEDTQSFELKDSISTSPSLPESLRGIFGTDDLRQLLDIEKVAYHLYDYHLQALAMVLNIREEFLRDILQKILKINPSSLRKINVALKSPFVQDRDLFTRTTSTEYGSPSSDAVSNSPVESSRILRIC